MKSKRLNNKNQHLISNMMT